MTNNPKNRQQWIFDLLKVEALSFVEVFSKYYEKFSKSQVTFSKDWNIVSTRLSEYQNKVGKAKEDVSIAAEVEALKSGLKLKKAHQLELQSEIDSLKKLLAAGYITKKVTIKGKVHDKTEVFGVYEIAQLQKVIDDKRKELFKLDGMYAPVKNSNTKPDGSEIEEPKQNFTDSQVDKILSELKKKK